MTTKTEINVNSRAVTMGSQIPMHSNSTGRTWTRQANAKTLRPYQEQVRAAARQAAEKFRWDIEKMEIGVKISVFFTFKRPENHFTKSGRLKKGAPLYPTLKTFGDIDKLERATFDALTKILYSDDSRVVENRSYKVFGERDSVRIVVEKMP